MALIATHKEIEFGVGDTVRVHQRIFDSAATDSKSRVQVFEGMVLSIGGRDMGKSVRLRKMSGTVGVELIFPIHAPVIEKVEVVKKGVEGSTHAKLYYVRTKSKREIDRIYSRVNKKTAPVKPAKTAKAK